jgi:hypothetical protein
MSKGGLEFGGKLHESARERPTFSNWRGAFDMALPRTRW